MKNNRRKFVPAIILAVVGAVLLGFIVSLIHSNISVETQRNNSHDKLELIYDLIQDSKTDEEYITEVYDKQYDSKARTVAFMANNVEGFAYTDDYMRTLRSLINVDYLAITDANGNVVAKAGGTSNDGTEYRTYSAKINDNSSVLISQNTEKLQNNLQENASLEYVLDGVHVGQKGFAFAVHAVKGTIIFYPDSTITGEMAADHGIEISSLKDGEDIDLTIDGTVYFCSVKQIDNGLIVCAVPRSEINANNAITVTISVIIYSIVIAVIILFTFFLQNEVYKKTESDEGEGESRGRYNSKIGRKIMVMSIFGAIIMFVVTFYMQTLFTLSQQSITNNARGTELLETLKTNDDTISVQSQEYEEEYTEKVNAATYIIQHVNQSKLTQDFMTSLRDVLDADVIQYFDTNGKIIAADTSLWSYSISKDENNQSYEFWSVLDGTKDVLIQDVQKDDEGNLKQYIGKAVLDGNHRTVGMVEICVSPQALSDAMVNTDITTVLKGIQTGNNGFAFAVNKESKTFEYFPDEKLIGSSIERYGMNESQVVSNYNDFITIDGKQYYCASGEYGNLMTYIAVPTDSINNTGLAVALVSTGISFGFMLILWAIFSFEKIEEEQGYESIEEIIEENVSEKEMVNVEVPNGRKKKSRSVATRWNHRDIPWEERSAGKKTAYVVNIILTIIAFIILIGVIFADKIFASDSLIHFILKGEWQRGLNIFSVTYCILITVCVIEITTIIRKILMILAAGMNAKGETILRLIDNFLKFAAIIGIVYYCLGTLGVDTAALWASAGILTLVVGLGAKSLVSDILAGLSIVFEGEFQVGDIVTIDSFRGTVVEVGIRTTKVKDGSGNVKIFSNSKVSNVLNMTKEYSVVTCDMSIEYEQDLHYVERILSEEFPNIKNKLTAIVDGPFYRGISELADSSVNIRIVAKCKEADRVQLERDLRRQLKLIFDKNNINIPYPQVVVNRPTKVENVTSFSNEVRAEAFVDEQKKEVEDKGIKEED